MMSIDYYERPFAIKQRLDTGDIGEFYHRPGVDFNREIDIERWEDYLTIALRKYIFSNSFSVLLYRSDILAFNEFNVGIAELTSKDEDEDIGRKIGLLINIDRAFELQQDVLLAKIVGMKIDCFDHSSTEKIIKEISETYMSLNLENP